MPSNYERSTCIKVVEDIKLDSSFYNHLAFVNVNYDDKSRKPINRIQTTEFMNKVMDVLLIKDTCWFFEEEVRFFAHEENIGKPLEEKGIVIHCSTDSIGTVIFSNDVLPKQWKQ